MAAIISSDSEMRAGFTSISEYYLIGDGMFFLSGLLWSLQRSLVVSLRSGRLDWMDPWSRNDSLLTVCLAALHILLQPFNAGFTLKSPVSNSQPSLFCTSFLLFSLHISSSFCSSWDAWALKTMISLVRHHHIWGTFTRAFYHLSFLYSVFLVVSPIWV